jgi:hypothetical protein
LFSTVSVIVWFKHVLVWSRWRRLRLRDRHTKTHIVLLLFLSIKGAVTLLSVFTVTRNPQLLKDRTGPDRTGPTQTLSQVSQIDRSIGQTRPTFPYYILETRGVENHSIFCCCCCTITHTQAILYCDWLLDHPFTWMNEWIMNEWIVNLQGPQNSQRARWWWFNPTQ